MQQFFEPALRTAFRLHDFASELLLRHGRFFRLLAIFAAYSALVAGIWLPEFGRQFGGPAGALLISILFLSPFAKITRMKVALQLLGFRRELGILMGCLAIAHGAGYFLDPYFTNGFRDSLASDGLSLSTAGIVFGIVGLVFTMPLFLTSNAFSLRVLGSARWKRIHFLVYPMFIFVVLHRFLIAREDGLGLLVRGLEAMALLGGYALLKYVAWKQESFLTIRSVIERIGGRYGQYSQGKTQAPIGAN